MLTPKENVIKLFINEKCKGCRYALWIYVRPFYYVTADGIKHRENKAALCRKYAKESRERCSGMCLVVERECERNDRYNK